MHWDTSTPYFGGGGGCFFVLVCFVFSDDGKRTVFDKEGDAFMEVKVNILGSFLIR